MCVCVCRSDRLDGDPGGYGQHGGGAVAPGEGEEGAFSSAGEHQCAVELYDLCQVGADGHLRHRF